MGRIIPYIMENKKCSKPPTSIDSYPLKHNRGFPSLICSMTQGIHPPSQWRTKMKQERVEGVRSCCSKRIRKNQNPPKYAVSACQNKL